MICFVAFEDRTGPREDGKVAWSYRYREAYAKDRAVLRMKMDSCDASIGPKIL